MLFGMVSGVSTLVFDDLYEFKRVHPFASILRAGVTIGIGFVFLLGFLAMIRNREDALDTARWVLRGLMASCIFCVIQHVANNFFPPLKMVTDAVTTLLTMTVADWETRSHGFALEPSWLGGQIVLLGIPSFAILAFLGGPGAFKWPHWQRGLVLLLLLLASVFSGSRVAILGSGVCMTLLVLAGGGLVRMVGMAFFSGILLFFLSYAGDDEGNQIVSYTRNSVVAIVNSESIEDVASGSSALARMVAWSSALKTFDQHPVLGVGWGLSPWWYASNVPDWAFIWPSGEVLACLDPEQDAWPNPKNMFVRLLAESGIIGTVLFCFAFLAPVISGWFSAMRSPGLRLCIALIFVGLVVFFMSVDSFAMPEAWLMFVMLLALPKKSPDGSVVAWLVSPQTANVGVVKEEKDIIP